MGFATDELSHDKAVVINDVSILEPGNIVSAAYLFDSVVTNEGCRLEFKGDYIPRQRGLVDLDKDGHDDVIISAPLTECGTGGISFWIYLWTNGNYRCIGEIGSYPSLVTVEEEPRCCFRRIWTYWRTSGTSGGIESVTISRDGIYERGHLPITTAGEGEPSIGRSLMEAIKRHATVPVRWERSVTRNGINAWIPYRVR